MTDIHIDDFNHDVALTLVRLYKEFPRRTTIYVEDIAGQEEPDEFGLHSKRYLSCLGAMLWLSEEGFIRYDSLIRQEAIDQVILTNACFVQLNTPSQKIVEGSIDSTAPVTINRSQQLIVNQLRAGLKSGSSNTLAGVVHELLSRMT